MSKNNGNGKGRKEHPLKITLRENKEAAKSFADLVGKHNKMQAILETLTSDGLKVGSKTIKVECLSVPTLSSILTEHGHTMRKGRPTASGSTVWKSKPQAVEAVCKVLKDHGLHEGRLYLLKNGISYTNEEGKEETFSFSNAKGKKLLSITTLSKVAQENAIVFVTGPRKERTKSLVTKEEQDANKRKIDPNYNLQQTLAKVNEDEEVDEDEDEEVDEDEDEEDEDDEDEEVEEDEDDEDEEVEEDEDDEDEDDEDEDDEDDEDEDDEDEDEDEDEVDEDEVEEDEDEDDEDEDFDFEEDEEEDD